MALIPAQVLALLFFLLSGCDEGEGTPLTGTATSLATAPTAGLIDRVSGELATRLRASPAEIAIVEACTITWPDSSIGVAEPGRIYTPALVEGWLVILEHEGEEYRYHGAGTDFIAADFVFDAAVSDARCP